MSNKNLLLTQVLISILLVSSVICGLRAYSRSLAEEYDNGYSAGIEAGSYQ
jgi:hypothetical protein